MTVTLEFTYNNGVTTQTTFSGRPDLADVLSFASIGLQVGDSIKISSIN